MGAALFPHTLPLPCSHGSRERHVPVHHTYTMPNRNQPVQGLFLPCCWGVWFFANLLFSGPIYMQFLLDSLRIFFDIFFLMVHKDRLERDLWFCGERLPHSHQKRQRGKVSKSCLLNMLFQFSGICSPWDVLVLQRLCAVDCLLYKNQLRIDFHMLKRASPVHYCLYFAMTFLKMRPSILQRTFLDVLFLAVTGSKCWPGEFGQSFVEKHLHTATSRK